MWFSGRIMYASFSLLLGFSIIGCTGNRLTDLGLKDGHLRPCPSSPNCVNSMGNEDEAHRIEPFVVFRLRNYENCFKTRSVSKS